MTFQQVLKQMGLSIEKTAKDSESQKWLTPRSVHRIAWKMGVPSQNSQRFDGFAKHVTGTSDMKQMNQWQLHALVRAMGHLRGVSLGDINVRGKSH